MLKGIEGEISAGFHIEDAGSVDPVAVTAEGVRMFQGADGVNRIQMTEHQDTGPVAAPRRTDGQDISVSIPTGDAFYLSADRRRFRLHDVGQAINRVPVWRRCLYLDPAANASEDFLIIDYRRVSRYFRHSAKSPTARRPAKARNRVRHPN